MSFKSESKPVCELPNSRAVGLGRDPAKGGSAEFAARNAKLDAAKKIEGLYSEVECHLLVNGNAFVMRHVSVGDPRDAQSVIGARLISVSETPWLSEAANVEIHGFECPQPSRSYMDPLCVFPQPATTLGRSVPSNA